MVSHLWTIFIQVWVFGNHGHHDEMSHINLSNIPSHLSSLQKRHPLPIVSILEGDCGISGQNHITKCVIFSLISGSVSLFP